MVRFGKVAETCARSGQGAHSLRAQAWQEGLSGLSARRGFLPAALRWSGLLARLRPALLPPWPNLATRFTPLTSRNTTHAMIRNLMTALMKLPTINCASPSPKLMALKSTPPITSPISGLTRSSTKEVTIAVNAAPIMMPTAISMTLPRAMNAFELVKHVVLLMQLNSKRVNAVALLVCKAKSAGQGAVGHVIAGSGPLVRVFRPRQGRRRPLLLARADGQRRA